MSGVFVFSSEHPEKPGFCREICLFIEVANPLKLPWVGLRPPETPVNYYISSSKMAIFKDRLAIRGMLSSEMGEFEDREPVFPSSSSEMAVFEDKGSSYD